MAGWSSLIRPAVGFTKTGTLLKNCITANVTKNAVQLRQMSDHGGGHFAIKTTRFQWDKFKDMVHYYVMIGLIPITAIVLYCNIFIGPAQLTEAPPGYTPKHWEYHKHPISRFLARYFYPSPQQEYEKMCHFLYEEKEKAMIRKLEQDVHVKMSERNDFQAYYYRPAIGKYHRVSKEAADYLESIRGD